MTPFIANRSQNIRVLSVLAVTQVAGWGAVSVLPVLAARIADDLGMTLPTVFAGTSAMYVTMGLCAPAAGRLFRAAGARRCMAGGGVLAAAGLALLAGAGGEIGFFAAWLVLGLAGAGLLTTAAYVYLSDFAGGAAKSLIGTLMLATGLATSLSWPVTAMLDQALGWRWTVWIFAAGMATVVPALLLLGLPEPSRSPAPAAEGQGPGARRSAVFWLVVCAICLNGFVTFGVQAITIELLKALGADTVRAVAVASLVGVFKVGGRLIDVVGGRRWDGLTTALVAGAMMPAGLVLLGFGGDGPLGIGGFLVLFGIGSGGYAVARATMPLAFYSKGEYATAVSAIALPLNLISALAPPVLALLLEASGAVQVMWALAGCSAAALVAVFRLTLLRGEGRTTA